MAYAKLQGIDQVIERLRGLPDQLRGQITRDAVKDGAEVLRQGIQAGAPVGPRRPKKGLRLKQKPIKPNIIIYERKNPEAYLQADKDNALSVLVGPAKQAFHAEWIEEGWTAVGRGMKVAMGHGSKTWTAFTRRAARPKKDNTHSQHGTTNRGKAVPGLHWIRNVGKSRSGAALEAMKASYRRALARLGYGI